ncbi:cytochrome P450 4F22 [Biomphalaria pfeifferi]|uniref:Cytochrome P450 4F22 n=1 Tax=Biomphalaria pfeifferi TaxID=112525 RepID=A0AAD8BVI5_BIOPF|nr:cytochrome P450 4F22 [Biomphalaria pfeifferi]
MCAILAYFVVKYALKIYYYRKAYFKLPTIPNYSYLTGTLHMFPGNNEEGLNFDFENAKKYCYFHLVWAGPFIPAVITYHPDVVKTILKSSAPKTRNPYCSSPYDMGLRWLGEGLLIANGEKWARSRRLLTPAFHFDILKPYVEVYNQCADILIDKIGEFAKNGQSFDMYNLVNLDALDIILRCAFSYQSDCQTTGSKSKYTTAIAELQSLWSGRSLKPHLHPEFIYSLTTQGKRFYKLCEIAHKQAEEVIDKRKLELASDPDLVSNKKCKDFLDILLTARDEDGQGLSPLEIRNEVDTFLFEGHDTTASGMTWTLYALAEHLEYQEKVYEEIVDVLQDREYIEWSDLPKLEFTTMCIKEALRLHTAVPFIERRLTEDVKVNGYTIPAGTRTAVHIWILHHNPHVWEDPLEYKPERFHPDNQKNMDPFQFVPFSAGPRNCIGQNFAMNEMKTTVSRIIKNFKLRLDPDQKACRTPTVTMKPEKGTFIYAAHR